MRIVRKNTISESDHLYILGDVFDRSSHNPNPVDLYFNIERLGKRCDVIRGNHDHWLAMYILEYYALPERKRSKIAPYSYNSFQLLQERLTPVDLQNLANTILSWPVQKSVKVKEEKYLLAHAMTSAPGVIKVEDYYLMVHLGIIFICTMVLPATYLYAVIQISMMVVYGKIEKKNLYIIDCGCGFSSGRLGCMCLETKEELYV